MLLNNDSSIVMAHPSLKKAERWTKLQVEVPLKAAANQGEVGGGPLVRQELDTLVTGGTGKGSGKGQEGV